MLVFLLRFPSSRSITVRYAGDDYDCDCYCCRVRPRSLTTVDKELRTWIQTPETTEGYVIKLQNTNTGQSDEQYSMGGFIRMDKSKRSNR